MIIRLATIEDAPAIAKVHVDSWRTTYRGIMPQSVLDALNYDKRTTLWENNILDPLKTTFVAQNNQGEIVGFVVGEKRTTNTEQGAADLSAIYLLESWQKRGIGKMLLKQAMQNFQQQGYQKVYVEVLADNKTRNFYQYYGAEYVKTIPFTIGGQMIDEEIYVWNDVATTLNKMN